MGDARRRKGIIAGQRENLLPLVKQVSHALRRLALAASDNLGGDCYTHAVLASALLADHGLTFRTKVGFAAWRVGVGDGDVLAHTPAVQGYLPEGALGFAYHAWLESGDWLLDFTTYQFQRKAAELDAADGGVTTVEWQPDFLLLNRNEVLTYREVARSPKARVAYYEESPELTHKLAAGYQLDEADLAAARLILQNPDMQVFGPNMSQAPA